jgi:predicted ArsR family transcriptional regulator
MVADLRSQMSHDENREAIRDCLEEADRDIARTTIAERVGCNPTTVRRHVADMDDVVETRRVRDTPLYEIQEQEKRFNHGNE